MAAPGWYQTGADPAGVERWWDGTQWTAATQAAAAPAPAPAWSAPTQPSIQPQPQQQPQQQPQSEPQPQPTAWAQPAAGPPAWSTPPLPAAAGGSGSKKGLVIGGALLLALLLVVGVAAVLLSGGDDGSKIAIVATTDPPVVPTVPPSPSTEIVTTTATTEARTSTTRRATTTTLATQARYQGAGYSWQPAPGWSPPDAEQAAGGVATTWLTPQGAVVRLQQAPIPSDKYTDKNLMRNYLRLRSKDIAHQPNPATVDVMIDGLRCVRVDGRGPDTTYIGTACTEAKQIYNMEVVGTAEVVEPSLQAYDAAVASFTTP